MVGAEDAVHIYQLLSAHGIQVWLTGGWGIDALLGCQTRTHKDLDLLLLFDEVTRMRELLKANEYGLKELWEENRWVPNSRGDEIATAFVLQDDDGHEVDAHVMRLDGEGNGIPEWEAAEGFIFKKEDLAGEGMIAGYAVQCITPKMQVTCHLGYEMPDIQRRDMELLHNKFRAGFPDE